MAASPVLLVHGGAGAFRADLDPKAARAALDAALAVGHLWLEKGGTALDAAVIAVESLEGSGIFNAGRGAVRASDGSISLDAAVMDGVTRAAGAVAALTGYAGAVALAREVMRRTPHVLLAGSGAEAFAAGCGFARASDDVFVDRGKPASSPGTVGAVALDAHGALAAATSTGGVRGKLPGRVGDSPILGAGTWADERCAVSATGEGEYFIRTVFAFRTASLIGAGLSVEESGARALAEVVRLGGAGGAIVLTCDGAWSMPATTAVMFRGVFDQTGARVAITLDEPLGPAG